MPNNKVNVLITGIGGGGIGEQLIKCLKLSSIDYKLIGTDSTNITKNINEVHLFYKVPLAAEISYIDRLVEICKIENIQIIFPGSEPELKAISRNRHVFGELNIFLPINPENVIDICLDKLKTNSFLKNNEFAYPLSIKVSKEADLLKINFLPAVLKPSIGGSGSANIMLAQTKEELLLFGKYLLNIYDEYIVQEYIGTADHEYTIGILLDMDGIIINSIALKRIITHGLGSKIKIINRTTNEQLGKHLVISSGISQGEIGKFPEITSMCESIALKIGAKSSINIQCRFFNQKIYVFEINPRYSGTSCMRAMVGYNEVEIMIKKYVLKEDIISNFKFKSGTLLRGLNETFLSI